MIIKDIITCLESRGFQRVHSNVDTIYLYEYFKNNITYFIYVQSTETGQLIFQNQQENILRQFEDKLSHQYGNIQFLKLFITDQLNVVRSIMKDDPYVWLIDTKQKQLVIYEQQISSYLGLEDDIIAILDRYRMDNKIHLHSNGELEETTWQSLKKRMCNVDVPICNFLIVAANVILFLLLEVLFRDGQYQNIVDRFGLYWPDVINNNEYYRLVTCMFLHSGMDHLVNNMLVLFVIGNNLEHSMGKIKYLTVYFGSGILAGLVSMGYNMVIGEEILSIGASGAIFGIVGAVAYIVVANKGHCEEISKRQIILFVAFSIYGGFTAVNVDNAAHIGGIIAGIILAIMLYRKPKKRGNYR